MFYISPKSYKLGLSAVKKRLSDFKGEEGAEYHVMKKRRPAEGMFSAPLYVYRQGKLQPTNKATLFEVVEA